MGKKPQPESVTSKVLFPIGGKLLVIISLLVLLSLSAVTALVYVFIKRDIGNTAEYNNRRVNLQSAAEAETLFTRIRGQTTTFLDIINTLDDNHLTKEQIDTAAALFFEQNREIAAIHTNLVSLINEPFFLSHEIESSPVSVFLNALAGGNVPTGEYKLVNGTPVFGIPVLALVYTRNKGGEQVTVLFSSQALTENLGSGTNPSFIIDYGDNSVLVNDSLSTGEDGISWFSASGRIPNSNAEVVTRVPSDVVFEGINATTRRNIYLTITVLSLSVLFIWFFSKTISRPLKELRAAAEQIETGNYKIEIENTSKDETGVLTKRFLSMSHALEHFERFTNRAVVNLARRGKLSLGGTSKNAVI
jgi:adenylate cyclase